MWEAAELFFRETGFSGGVHMELVKQIPSEAGMGGGSSDAAAVLRGLNRMTGQRLSLAALTDMGAGWGLMFPSAWQAGAGVCEGIGEKTVLLLPVWAGLPVLSSGPVFHFPQGKLMDCWRLPPVQGRYGRKLYRGFEK